jgi:hypothetical protein
MSHYHVHHSLSLDMVNPAPQHKFLKYVAKLTSHVGIILPKGILPRDFSNKMGYGTYVPSDAFCVSHLLYTRWLNNLNYKM